MLRLGRLFLLSGDAARRPPIDFARRRARAAAMADPVLATHRFKGGRSKVSCPAPQRGYLVPSGSTAVAASSRGVSKRQSERTV
jgi:hypothetical protein